MQKLFLIFAGLFGLLGNALGAFGAHALKTKLSPTMLAIYQAGAQYQFYHALALLAVSVLLFHIQSTWLNLSGLAFIAGILLFSGSLYLLSITGIKWIGIITPIGGLSFILGWLFLIIAVIQFKG
ncbi:TPA: DUF423 domain-containing protein [Legionella pneumophila subsp. pneumophila]|nr:DUF423 domain-containing protein [Legionella pneumophila subsp. pneumophila]HAU0786463.1 DUF423 domain-containing protein [Legionella pneumophila]HAU0811896.1 DUF423 domain-containing protein [Legionella pneumophila]HAU0907745.1 DUF423 domain-containing protein [Legionella pneumophila]HAU0937516.1 DUF423 domain-containing protein [Legionella pneumophila]